MYLEVGTKATLGEGLSRFEKNQILIFLIPSFYIAVVDRVLCRPKHITSRKVDNMGIKSALLVLLVLAILVLLPCDAQAASRRSKSKPRPSVREEVSCILGHLVVHVLMLLSLICGASSME